MSRSIVCMEITPWRTASNLIRGDGPDLMDVHATFMDTIWISKLIKVK